jgi:uncharacterized nucleotidyltransferase DUF6036
MRAVADTVKIRRFMNALAQTTTTPVQVYFTGGATAVLIGWRTSTIDVDIHLIPDDDRLLRGIPRLKDDLQINVELACPAHFIPELPGWKERSLFIDREGTLSFFHYDFYAQALAKIERGHSLDMADVEAMFQRGLVQAGPLMKHFEAVEGQIYRYPALDARAFRSAVENAIDGLKN